MMMMVMVMLLLLLLAMMMVVKENSENWGRGRGGFKEVGGSMKANAVQRFPKMENFDNALKCTGPKRFQKN